METLTEQLPKLAPAGATLLLAVAVLAGAQWLLERRWGAVAGSRWRIQLVLLALTFVGLLAVITALPLGDTLRGQILSLVGVLLSAAIALSSTTFVGNAMAGVLLRVVRNFELGDFVEIGEHFGRVSERGLFHTEIQTEDRDLTTLPNLYLVTQPVKLIRASGTIISARVSLGYDVARQRIEERLLAAAAEIGLEEPFVQVVELGDFSVTYRVAGLLREVKQLLTARSRLHQAVLDELHRGGIEIVSPSFMNTRAVAEGQRFMPPREPAAEVAEAPVAEAVAFDKAERAEASEQPTEPAATGERESER